MGALRSGRFLCTVWHDTEKPRIFATQESLPHHHEERTWLLRSDSPVYETPQAVFWVAGTVWDPDTMRKKSRGQLVAELFAQYGPTFPSRLEGWFLALVYDRVKDELIIANNTYTSSGCYYHFSSGRLVLTDSIRRMLSTLDSPPPFRHASLVNYLNNGFNHTENTCFEGIFKLLPGYLLRFASGNLSIERYYSLKFDRRREIDVEEAINEYYRLFQDDIKAFLDAGAVQEAGGAISGGLDTSWTFYHLAMAHRRPVHGFTIYFGQKQYDEVDDAEKVVRVVGGVHHRILFDPGDLDLFPIVIEMTGEPVLSVALPIYKMIRECRGLVDALVMGEGGNNIYNIYYPVAEAHRYLKHLPWSVRRAFFRALYVIGVTTGNEMINLAAHVAKIYAARNDYLEDYFERLTSHFHFDREARQELLDPVVFGGIEFDQSRYDLPLSEETFFDDLIRQNITWGLKHYLLFFEHRMATESGLLIHAPFVSRAVVRFVNTLPMKWVVGGTTFERLLKRTSSDRPFHRLALRRIYGDIHERKNAQLFYAPYLSMFQKRPSAADALLRALKRRGWYNVHTLERIFKEFRCQSEHPRFNFRVGNHGQRLMALLGCEVFARLFLDGLKVNPSSPPAIEDFLIT